MIFTAHFLHLFALKAVNRGDFFIFTTFSAITAFLTKSRRIHRFSYKNLPKFLDPGVEVDITKLYELIELRRSHITQAKFRGKHFFAGGWEVQIVENVPMKKLFAHANTHANQKNALWLMHIFGASVCFSKIFIKRSQVEVPSGSDVWSYEGQRKRCCNTPN